MVIQRRKEKIASLREGEREKGEKRALASLFMFLCPWACLM